MLTELCVKDNLERKMDVENKHKLSLYRNSPGSDTVGISTQEVASMNKTTAGHPLPFLFFKAPWAPMKSTPSLYFLTPSHTRKHSHVSHPEMHAPVTVDNTAAVCFCLSPSHDQLLQISLKSKEHSNVPEMSFGAPQTQHPLKWLESGEVENS